MYSLVAGYFGQSWHFLIHHSHKVSDYVIVFPFACISVEVELQKKNLKVQTNSVHM